jgi:hypothetical protein
VRLTIDLLTPKSIGTIFLLWVVYICDMVALRGKDNVLEPGNCISTLMSSALDLWTAKSIGNIFLPWVVYMCGMVTLGCKDNVLDPRNRIQCAWPLTFKSIGNIFLPWVVHIFDMVTLGGKGNVLEPGNHCVYRRTDGQPDSSIPPTTSLRGYKESLTLGFR